MYLGGNKVENEELCKKIGGLYWNITELLKKFSLFLTQPYMGHTGYSTTENVNNIKIVHLHWGLQLIFDESECSRKVAETTIENKAVWKRSASGEKNDHFKNI